MHIILLFCLKEGHTYFQDTGHQFVDHRGVQSILLRTHRKSLTGWQRGMFHAHRLSYDTARNLAEFPLAVAHF